MTAAQRRPARIGARLLEGELATPPDAMGLVLFAHGSGSSRLSPRNTHVAEALQSRGFATLLFDLLTEAEAADRRRVFDIPLLAARLGEALDWARAEAPGLPLGLFGASTGAAAALVAAASAPTSPPSSPAAAAPTSPATRWSGSARPSSSSSAAPTTPCSTSTARRSPASPARSASTSSPAPPTSSRSRARSRPSSTAPAPGSTRISGGRPHDRRPLPRPPDRRHPPRRGRRPLMREHPEIADPVLLALPRGGVPVALEIARALRAPLDLVMVRKIGVPWQPELAAAAVVDGDAPQLVVNRDVVAMAGMTEAELEAGRAARARRDRPPPHSLSRRPRPVPVEGRDAIFVDDGIATGATTRAALKGVRRRRPRSLTLAVPVAPRDTLEKLAGEVDHLVCLAAPSPFYAIGAHYADFAQVSDDEVIRMLREAEGFVAPGAPP
jgi:putative phosphoribosyl transferase